MNGHTVEQSALILATARAIERDEGVTMAQAIVEAERRWREREAAAVNTTPTAAATAAEGKGDARKLERSRLDQG